VIVGNPSPVTAASSIGLTPADPNFSMVDACNAVKQGQVAGPATINPLSALLAGLDPVTCKVSPESDSFENVFPYNPTTSKVFYPGTLTNQPLNNGVAKVDWNINDRHHLNGYYFNSTSTQISGGGVKSYWNTTGDSKTIVMAGGWTWIPNSSWVNDLRIGWGASTASGLPGDSNRIVSNPWPNGYGLPTGQSDPAAGGFPLINFAGSSGGGGGSTTTGIITGLGVPGTTGTRGPQGQLNIKDSVSYLRGNHAFKFGAEHVWVKFNNSTSTDARGQLDFPSLAAFLQGLPDSGLIRSNIQLETDRARWYAAFVQDTWRITHRLTLTPGLRYEYQGAPHDIFGQLGTFDPTVPGGIAQVGSGLPHSSLYSPEKLGFFPRFGFAWDAFGNGKTVLRGGVSLMSGTIPMTGVTQQTPFGSTMCINTCVDPITKQLIPANIVVNRFSLDINKTAPQQLSFTSNQLKWDTTGPIFPIGGALGAYCDAATPCVTGAPDPNYKRPKAVEWNLDIQRAITRSMTIDVAYVGNHGYDEFGQVDLNAPPLFTGWTAPWTGAQITTFNNSQKSASTRLNVADVGFTSEQICAGLAVAADAGKCNTNALAIVAAQPYNAQFPYLSYIERSTGSLGIYSNYNGLQVTVDQRSFHGLSFLSGYTYSHGLDISSSVSRGVRQMIDPTNPRLSYGSGDNDVRHTFRISPTWVIPGIKSPAQMLQGWSISGIFTVQGRFPYSALDNRKNDWIGTGETNNTFVSSGVSQYWNFSGPTDAFNSSNVPIPCYGKLAGCTAFASAPQAIQDACTAAAQAPYTGNSLFQTLALKSLANNGCYIQNGGVMTPPAYGTIGNAGKNSFRGPQYKNVDMSVTKDWHIKERYGAQFRVEFFNVFNRADYGAPGSNPTAGGAQFGFSQATPDATNAVFGTGGPRHVQFGLKLTF
jgi:hypothetical protein